MKIRRYLELSENEYKALEKVRRFDPDFRDEVEYFWELANFSSTGLDSIGRRTELILRDLGRRLRDLVKPKVDKINHSSGESEARGHCACSEGEINTEEPTLKLSLLDAVKDSDEYVIKAVSKLLRSLCREDISLGEFLEAMKYPNYRRGVGPTSIERLQTLASNLCARYNIQNPTPERRGEPISESSGESADVLNELFNSYLDYHSSRIRFLGYFSVSSKRDPARCPYSNVAPSFFANVILDTLTSFERFLSADIERDIYRHRILIGEHQTLEELGDRHSVTRERVRQIEVYLIERLSMELSPAFEYFEYVLAHSLHSGSDIFDSSPALRSLFPTRFSFIDFLSALWPQFKGFESEIMLPSGIDSNAISEFLLLNRKMPLSITKLKDALKEEFNINNVQVAAYLQGLREDGSIQGDSESIKILARNKYLAAANAAIGYINGIHWRELAQRTVDSGLCQATFRVEHSPCGGISQNKYLYLYGHGVYRLRAYLEISPEDAVDLVLRIKSLFADSKLPAMDLYDLYRSDGELGRHSFFDLLHICKETSDLFIVTSSSRSLLIRDQEFAQEVRSEQIHLQNLEQPRSTFEFAQTLKSSSEHHAMSIINELVKENKVVQVDSGRFVALTSINEEHLAIAKSKIKEVLESDPWKIFAAHPLKLIVESENSFRYTRHFYSSLARILASESGFYFSRNLVSAKFDLSDLSLARIAESAYLRHPTFNEEQLISLLERRVVAPREALRRAISNAKRLTGTSG